MSHLIMDIHDEYSRQVEMSLIRARHAFEAEIQKTKYRFIRRPRQKRSGIDRITQVNQIGHNYLCTTATYSTSLF